MTKIPSFQLLKVTIEQQLQEQAESGLTSGKASVTISRALGCGALGIARELAKELRRRGLTDRAATVLDRELVKRVAEDPLLPGQLAAAFPSVDARGVRRPLPRVTTETVRRLCRLGNVIIVDRAACLMAADLERTLRVRLVGSLARRVERVVQEQHQDRSEAQAMVEAADASNAAFLKDQLGKTEDNPLLYHLVVNTDHFRDSAVVQTIAAAVEQLQGLTGSGLRRDTTRPLRKLPSQGPEV